MTVISRIPWTPVEVARNFVPNPRASGTALWNAGAASGSGHVAALSSSGSVPTAPTSTLTTSGGASTGSWWLDSSIFPITPGLTAVSVAGRFRGTSGSQARISVLFYDASNAQIGSISGDLFTLSGTLAVQKLQDVAVPAGAVNARVRLVRVGGTAGDTLGGYQWIMNAGSTSLTFFSGATANTPIVTYTWVGAADASASVMSIPDPADQVTPLTALAPYTSGRESRTIAHDLLEQATSVYTYRPPSPAVGILDLGFDNYAAALAARTFLTGNYAFGLDETVLTDVPMFRVTGGALELVQDDTALSAWHVMVPWKEATA